MVDKRFLIELPDGSTEQYERITFEPLGGPFVCCFDEVLPDHVGSCYMDIAAAQRLQRHNGPIRIGFSDGRVLQVAVNVQWVEWQVKLTCATVAKQSTRQHSWGWPGAD